MSQALRRCPACLRTTVRYYAAIPQPQMPPASESASSAAQPLSTPMTPAPQPVKQKRAVASICKEGTVIKNINIFKNRTDPVAKADSEYPEFLWNLLNQEKTEKQQSRAKNRATIKRKNFFSGKL